MCRDDQRLRLRGAGDRAPDYLGSWLAILREDNRAIVRAASAASKAADFLLAFGRAEGEAPDLAQAA